MAATHTRTAPRVPLSRARVLETAVTLADQGGIDAVTMRRLAKELGVEAMSLYHHVANKDDILDGMVDLVFGEIELPDPGAPWKEAMRRRVVSVRRALLRHPWALAVLESRTAPGPATLRHHEAVLGNLRGAGFSVAAAARALALLDSYVYGFVLQELTLPFDTPRQVVEVATSTLERLPLDEYPRLAEMITEHALQPGYAFANEFEPGLDLVLGALERARRSTAP